MIQYSKMKVYSVRETKIKEGLEMYPELLQLLLSSRNIENPEEFLNPDYSKLHDPFLMKDMNKAVERILRAIKNDEKIVVYSDYDCDGGPGGVLMHDFFKKIGYKNFVNYIPHRHKEGYGLNTNALDELKARLLITVDLGITDCSQVDHANSIGTDVIITDHHIPGNELPKAYAILNAKQKDCTYPFDGLCGTGVAFKLVQALLPNFSVKEGWEKWLLDMVGLATVADMVPLVGENRIFAHYGLLVLRKSRRIGLMKMCRKMNVKQWTITEDDIGFMIAPRINAASRMGVSMDAFRLLTTEDEVEADILAKHLNKINNERKGIVAAMSKEIKKRISSLEKINDVIVMGKPDWRPSLLGLSANSMVEEYNRPVFLWGREETGIIKGSCRSDGRVSVVALMEEVKDSLIEFGGHAFSGGFSVLQENVYFLEEKLSAAYNKLKINIDETLFVDKLMDISDVTWDTYTMLEKLGPFGMGNPKPLFLFENVTVTAVQYFGKEKNHLRLSFGGVDAIEFFTKRDQIEEGSIVTLVANIEKSVFLNKRELRLRIVDIV